MLGRFLPADTADPASPVRGCRPLEGGARSASGVVVSPQASGVKPTRVTIGPQAAFSRLTAAASSAGVLAPASTPS